MNARIWCIVVIFAISLVDARAGKSIFIALLNFPDKASPFTRDQLAASVNEACAYFYSSSYHATSVTPTVTARFYTLPHPSSYYANSNYRNLISADAQAIVRPDYGDVRLEYDFVMYWFPNITHAGNFCWPPEVWINGVNSPWILVHEIGHEYGLTHSHRWIPCDLSNPVDPCGRLLDYGDCWDQMGSQGATHDFNPYEKLLLAWMPQGKIKAVTASGVYRVYRFDDVSAINNPTLALSFPEPGTGQTFYVAYRYAPATARNGAYIIWGDDWSPKLIDHSPATQRCDDSIWPVSSTLVDGQLRISPIRIGGIAPNAWIDVQVLLP